LQLHVLLLCLENTTCSFIQAFITWLFWASYVFWALYCCDGLQKYELKVNMCCAKCAEKVKEEIFEVAGEWSYVYIFLSTSVI
jgi:hypothetical protein